VSGWRAGSPTRLPSKQPLRDSVCALLRQLDPVALLAGLAHQPQPSVATQLQIPGRSPPQ
jgi:hypothetical protein